MNKGPPLHYFSYLHNAHWISSHTGCPKPCQYRDFVLETQGYAKPYHRDKEVYLRLITPDPRLEVVKEYEAFDFFAMIGEIGGAVGLFLGWSLRSLLAGPIQRQKKWLEFCKGK